MTEPTSGTLRVDLELPAAIEARLRAAALRSERTLAQEIEACLAQAFADETSVDHIVQGLDTLLENHPSQPRLDALSDEAKTAVRDGLKRQLADSLEIREPDPDK